MENSCPVINANIVFREEDQDALLFNPDTGVIKVVNPMGVFIWKLCNGEHNVDEINQKILEHSEGESQDKIKQDLDEFLKDLEKNNLISYKKF